MFVFIPTTFRIRYLWRNPLFALLLFIAAMLPGFAQGTHLWTQSRIDEFEKGTPQGVALSSDGHINEGPALTEALTTQSTYVWSVAVDSSGTAYLGTASPATVLRVGKDGKPFTLFDTKDMSVQVVRLSPDGALYAATLPSGKVYRLNPAANTKQDESNATEVFDAGKLDEGKPSDVKAGEEKSTAERTEGAAHYIWDLTFDSTGRLYIATGGPAAVYRVDTSTAGGKTGAKPEQFFHCDEQHIRTLAWDKKGDLIAGTDGSGLVYRINAQGKGYVLFEAPKREITAVAVGASGTIYAASVGEKSRVPLPPLPVGASGGTITITLVQPGSLQAANASSSVPEGSEIYALAPDLETRPQAPRKLWAGKDEIVYALAARKDGLIALTGNRGRVFRIADNGDYADVAHLDAQQGLSLAVASGQQEPGGRQEPASLLIGTGNTGKLFRFGSAAEKHEYASDVLDAGALARFGRIEVEPGSSGYELLTRTGNVEQPSRGRNDWGWTDWQPLKDGAVASPAGRYLQWKAVLGAGGTLGSVGVNYLPVNSAPVVDEVVVVPGARVNAQNQIGAQPPPINIAFPSANQAPSTTYDAGMVLQAVKDKTAVTVRWSAHDDDGDDLTFSLYLRGDGETVWRLLKDGITERFYTFDATLIPDGGYEIKVVASDSPSHTAGDALTGGRESERFEVDTTPPVVSGLKVAQVQDLHCGDGPCPQPFKVSFDAEDGFSPIAHAEYSIDAGPWQFIEPVGGLSDSKHEHYELTLHFNAPSGKLAEHLIAVRVYDRHDNVGVAKTVSAARQM